ncbi:MAG: hypothetical protein WAV28_06260 [Sedimentisphaerales bacterium]|jgi:hypothetical protein
MRPPPNKFEGATLVSFNNAKNNESKEDGILAFERSYLTAVAITLVAAMTCTADFQANTHTSNKQENPAIAMDAEGNFVIVWNSYLQDGSSNGIFGRRFDPNCKPLSDEFRINTTTSGNQREPSVAMNADGNFVVAWYGPGEDKEDIFARRFSANGQPIGSEFRVNTYTNDKQLYPSAAMSNDGGFVIVWESMNVPEQGKKGICGQLYDSTGSSIGPEFVINEEASDSRYPDAAMDADGNFAVVWLLDKSSNSIIARLYNAEGTAKTEPFELSTIRFSSITEPSIAMDKAGNFVVAWDGDPKLAGQDDIHVRCYNPEGTAVSGQFIVNTTIEGPQQNPQAAMDELGRFIIVWDSKIDPDINERDIFAQRYDSAGGPLGNEFQVNTYMTDDQKRPAAAITENGKFVIAWQSYGQDGSDYGIFVQPGQMVGSADFNGDGFVNFYDYCILAEEWLKSGGLLKADLIDDNKVDGQDLAEFRYQWLTLQE